MDLLDAFIAGFYSVFQWPNFGFMLIGVVVGGIIGILPGLGATVGLTLLLPFTFFLEPAAAFSMLLATVTVSQNTSDFTSILFGVPGDAASSALIVDGYPMAKKGEAGRALSANLGASLIGAVIGMFALLAAIPVVRPLVLSFGSPEFFFASITGLTFVSILSGRTKLLGVAAALLGLLIAVVGMDPQSSIPRYTFGRVELWEGVSLLPVALGLFAIPEIYELARSGSTISAVEVGRTGGVWQGIRDVVRHRWLVVRCSLIGTFIGILPGMGTPLSQWMAYAHAVQSSDDKDRFGKGAPEGALGPGAANNSGLGGSLIPTIAFGIPGSVPMAILLGAFLIQGITPGPEMLTTQIDLTVSLVWIVVISNIIVTALFLPLLGHMAKVTSLDSAIMVPIMTILVYVGAYAPHNSMTDMVILLITGFIAIAMVRLGWPRPPLILGLVLGGLAETYLYISYRRYEFGFLSRPMVVALIVLIVGTLAAPVVVPRLRAKFGWQRRSAQRSYAGQQRLEDRPPTGPPQVPDQGVDSPTRPVGPAPAGWQRIDANVVAGATLTAVGLVALWLARGWPLTAGLMPWTVAGSLAIVSGAYTVSRLLRGGGPHQDPTPEGQPREGRPYGGLIAVTWLVGAMLIIWLLGLAWAGPILTGAYLLAFGKQRWYVTALVAGAVSAGIWLLGSQLEVSLPPGVLS